ncbi:uncharacterized protein BDR25DRAFT_357518 [Lindgomyces ingoldianus]|uniref:Uncharacterized protein n=1 Tax=Lindgomyces ingoldianus TaxID=673940 RepID=A0ACB6QNJ4_9PLEO|nr:uncharacterized protein BDR25DRAFT_357518 [Lindgomyces ingoldianus]KAF2468589.1 hypothetical protein BDR25DRAFT_357518 [Lindgomyces ingoldianus]
MRATYVENSRLVRLDEALLKTLLRRSPLKFDTRKPKANRGARAPTNQPGTSYPSSVFKPVSIFLSYSIFFYNILRCSIVIAVTSLIRLLFISIFRVFYGINLLWPSTSSGSLATSLSFTSPSSSSSSSSSSMAVQTAISRLESNFPSIPDVNLNSPPIIGNGDSDTNATTSASRPMSITSLASTLSTGAILFVSKNANKKDKVSKFIMLKFLEFVNTRHGLNTKSRNLGTQNISPTHQHCDAKYQTSLRESIADLSSLKQENKQFLMAPRRCQANSQRNQSLGRVNLHDSYPTIRIHLFLSLSMNAIASSYRFLEIAESDQDFFIHEVSHNRSIAIIGQVKEVPTTHRYLHLLRFKDKYLQPSIPYHNIILSQPNYTLVSALYDCPQRHACLKGKEHFTTTTPYSHATRHPRQPHLRGLWCNLKLVFDITAASVLPVAGIEEHVKQMQFSVLKLSHVPFSDKMRYSSPRNTKTMK